ncbi:unnamed protein product [Closterium sp. NIES-65]|nr:unnamed protein product [Closterium sp. NIES-65]
MRSPRTSPLSQPGVRSPRAGAGEAGTPGDARGSGDGSKQALDSPRMGASGAGGAVAAAGGGGGGGSVRAAGVKAQVMSEGRGGAGPATSAPLSGGGAGLSGGLSAEDDWRPRSRTRFDAEAMRKGEIKPRSMKERRRRDKISEGLRQLRQAIPESLLGAQQDMGAMIEAAVLHISNLQARCSPSLPPRSVRLHFPPSRRLHFPPSRRLLFPPSRRLLFPFPSPSLPLPVAFTFPSRCLHFPFPSPSLPLPVAFSSPSRRLLFPFPSPSLPLPVAFSSPSRRLLFPFSSPSLPPPVAFNSPFRLLQFPLPSPSLLPPNAFNSPSGRLPRMPHLLSRPSHLLPHPSPSLPLPLPFALSYSLSLLTLFPTAHSLPPCPLFSPPFTLSSLVHPLFSPLFPPSLNRSPLLNLFPSAHSLPPCSLSFTRLTLSPPPSPHSLSPCLLASPLLNLFPLLIRWEEIGCKGGVVTMGDGRSREGGNREGVQRRP